MRSVAEILSDVRKGTMSVSEAEKLLKLDALAVVGEIARLDYNRFLRRGVPEIVYAQSKTDRQILEIVRRLAKTKIESETSQMPVIFSKVNPNQVRVVRSAIASSRLFKSKLSVKHFKEARIIAITSTKEEKKTNSLESRGNKKTERGRVALLAAGTSDSSALSEAEVILNLLDCETIRFNDVGVAALQRLLEPMKRIVEFDPDAIIVAAGMEGALPSVIAGLSSVPVIGLPTSIGGGFGGKGEAALMSMLQACPLGLSVVNIDGGVPAGVVAWLISKRAHERSES